MLGITKMLGDKVSLLLTECRYRSPTSPHHLPTTVHLLSGLHRTLPHSQPPPPVQVPLSFILRLIAQVPLIYPPPAQVHKLLREWEGFRKLPSLATCAARRFSVKSWISSFSYARLQWLALITVGCRVPAACYAGSHPVCGGLPLRAALSPRGVPRQTLATEAWTSGLAARVLHQPLADGW